MDDRRGSHHTHTQRDRVSIEEMYMDTRTERALGVSPYTLIAIAHWSIREGQWILYIVSDERDKVEEKSPVKQAILHECLPRLANIQYTKKRTSKKSPVVLQYIQGMSEQIRGDVIGQLLVSYWQDQRIKS